MKRLLFLCALLMPVSLAIASLKVHQGADPLTDTRILTTAPLVLHGSKLHTGHSAYMALIFERTQRHGAGPQFHLDIFCGPSKGRVLDVPAGNSLVVVIDGQATSYYSEGTAAKHAAPGARDRIQPHVFYEDIPSADWDAMAKAKTVRLQVIGPAGTVAADLDKHELETLRQFVTLYVHGPVSELD